MRWNNWTRFTPTIFLSYSAPGFAIFLILNFPLCIFCSPPRYLCELQEMKFCEIGLKNNWIFIRVWLSANQRFLFLCRDGWLILKNHELEEVSKYKLLLNCLVYLKKSVCLSVSLSLLFLAHTHTLYPSLPLSHNNFLPSFKNNRIPFFDDDLTGALSIPNNQVRHFKISKLIKTLRDFNLH